MVGLGLELGLSGSTAPALGPSASYQGYDVAVKVHVWRAQRTLDGGVE